ncbi:iron ABC transporter permease [Lentzea sp. HUAS12]|uniref:FecCD family ABC transporter permease n=1 Tax=Lentzea sp. HUAS12 TaxID=2951806 RepID=UPI00209C88B5|nr:iron ABC transporter permease [Lentzea sp. HUAS12]USX54023.1 iron ABC transporter permease [Lentzea sp. HUAS12]
MSTRTTRSERTPLLGTTKSGPLTAVLLAVLLGSMVVAIGVGPVTVPTGEVWDVVLHHLFGTGEPGRFDFIVWELRAPRVLQGAFVGAALAVAGLLTQAMTRNPLGEPYVLGLSSGAAVGAVLVITTIGSTALGLLTLPAAAFGGALLTAVAVFALSRSGSVMSPGRMVMAGVAVAQLLSGVVSFLLLRTKDPEAQQQVLFWLLGSFAGAEWALAAACAALVSVMLVVALALGGRLNLLVLGDDAAAALGLDAARLRAVLLVVVTLLTGCAVAVSGSIGFVGLVVPNLTRLLVGADHRRAAPVAALLGALVLVWADTAARLVLAPTELPIGILTAAVGVPVFLVVLRRSSAMTTGVS